MAAPDKRLEERIALVTGASRGLGRAITTAALEAGDRVLATARRPAALADLTARYPDRLRTARTDVTDPVAVQRSIDHLVHAFGKLGATSRTEAVTRARAHGLLA